MQCLIASLGKDTPGVNAVIRASTRVALRRELEVMGARRGFPGVIDQEFWRMSETHVEKILGKGGCILGSADYQLPSGAAADEALERIAASLRRFDLVVAIGGIGSFSVLNQVYAKKNVGLTTTLFIPATVENEFLDPKHGTSLAGGVHAEAVGADTAANTAIQAIDRLREQSYLTRTIFMIQCVGLKSNFLPLQIGLGCGAHRIYLPEFPRLTSDDRAELRSLYGAGFDPNRVNTRELVGWIESMFRRENATYLISIIANGIPLFDVDHSGAAAADIAERHYDQLVTSMAPVELTVLRVVDHLSVHFADKRDVQVRYIVLDDLQRGGDPSLRDRVLGSFYGNAAVSEFLRVVDNGEFERRGTLSLVAAETTNTTRCRFHSREEVEKLYIGSNARAGGLDALPILRQCSGMMSSFQPLTPS